MKILSIFLLIFYPLVLFSQSCKLFLISGTPFEFERYRPNYPVIYSCQENGIDTIVQLSNKQESIIMFLNVYPELNELVMYETLFNDSSTYLTIIDLSNPECIKNKALERNEGSIESNMVVINALPVYCMDFLGKKFVGYTKEFEEKILNADDFNSSFIIGEAGGAIRNVEFLLLYKDKIDNLLHISKGYNQQHGPIFKYQPDNDYDFKFNRLYSLEANNSEFLIMNLDKSIPVNDSLGHTELLCLNKKSKKWFTFNIKGNYSTNRLFANWLSGEVTSKNIGSYQTTSGRIDFNFGKISPGIELRKKISNNKGFWGETFDERAETFGNYFPGILYLLNIETKSYIEWNTYQGDSEILLVDHEIVYYRVNDKIFKAPINDGEKLGKSELLIHDARVPDIHWAFISDK